MSKLNEASFVKQKKRDEWRGLGLHKRSSLCFVRLNNRKLQKLVPGDGFAGVLMWGIS